VEQCTLFVESWISQLGRAIEFSVFYTWRGWTGNNPNPYPAGAPLSRIKKMVHISM
jgi:hypothetical protein